MSKALQVAHTAWNVGDASLSLRGNQNSLYFSKAPGKTTYKLRKNGNFYAKSVFHKIDFVFCCNSKINE